MVLLRTLADTADRMHVFRCKTGLIASDHNATTLELDAQSGFNTSCIDVVIGVLDELKNEMEVLCVQLLAETRKFSATSQCITTGCNTLPQRVAKIRLQTCDSLASVFVGDDYI
jgi:hypothetical protein